MSRRVRLSAAAAGFVAALGLAVAAMPAGGLTPPPPGRAELVFSNAGKLVRMAADGSGRSVLTNAFLPLPGGPTGGGDYAPRPSPDGSLLMFTRLIDDGGIRLTPWLMISGPNGEAPKRILRTNGSTSYASPDWMPDGSIVAVREVARKKRTERAVIQVGINGGPKRVLVKLRPLLTGSRQLKRKTNERPTALAASPDGSKLLISFTDARRDERRWLDLADLSTGERRTIVRGGSAGAWSSDGSRIAYVSSKGKKKLCSNGECFRPSDLFVAGPSGEAPKRLTNDRASEGSPSWSPDGTRIAFSSDRNAPGVAGAEEVYTITPEGTCQTWLTNGTPFSVEPAWVPGVGESGPLACGGHGRKPLREVEPLARVTAPLEPRLWAGREIGGRLLTWDFEIVGIEVMTYMDCAYYAADRCGPHGFQFSMSSCLQAGSVARELGKYRGTPRKRRGVLTFFDPKDGLSVFSGGAVHMMYSARMDRGAPSVREIRRGSMGYFRATRRLGAGAGTRLLPAYRVPRRDFATMERVSRAVKRSGSVRVAARRLGMEPKRVRENRRALVLLTKYGRVRPVKCPNPLAIIFGGIFEKRLARELGDRVPAAVRERFEALARRTQ